MNTNIATRTVAAVIIGGLATGSALANQVKLDVSLANPVLQAGTKQTTYLKVGLTGFRMKGTRRTPVNVALVIDKSGSMSGQKIQRAKEAALQAIDRLSGDDIVSIVAYDSRVTILVPATKASDKAAIRQGINRLSSGGSTALHAGTCKGAAEVRKFLARDRVNRVILLSDGLANVGPDTPGALGELGATLAKEGISVTTLGLGDGYNEDLMSRLAQRSDGNHAFIERADDLARIFNAEFGEVLSVVAQEVLIEIDCGAGVRPVRVLNRDAEIAGQKVIASISQILSSQEKYLMLEVEVPPTRHANRREIASVHVSYANMETETTDRLASAIDARFSESKKDVDDNIKKPVMAEAVMQVATVQNELATSLRDAGKVEEARQTLEANAALLKKQAEKLDSQELDAYYQSNVDDSKNLDASSWNLRRKSMRDSQYRNKFQRTY